MGHDFYWKQTLIQDCTVLLLPAFEEDSLFFQGVSDFAEQELQFPTIQTTLPPVEDAL